MSRASGDAEGLHIGIQGRPMRRPDPQIHSRRGQDPVKPGM